MEAPSGRRTPLLSLAIPDTSDPLLTRWLIRTDDAAHRNHTLPGRSHAYRHLVAVALLWWLGMSEGLTRL